MKRVQHPSNNAVLRAPSGTPIEECSALSVTRIEYENGQQAVAAYFQPSDEELMLLLRGAPVRLVVIGTSFMPVSLGVDGDGG